MSANETYDVAVIGAGPGGYVSGIRAAQLGAKVAVIEKGLVGGTCLNVGCIPTKTLIASTELIRQAGEAEEFGVEIPKVIPHWDKMQERKDKVSETLRKGIEGLFKAHKITLIRGVGKLESPTEVEVQREEGSDTISAEKMIIATGSDPAQLPTFDFSQSSVLTSTEALSLESVPKSLIIVGSGVIGSEFACIFSELDTEITMVELMDRMLPTEDTRISKQMKSIFRRQDIQILTETTVEEVLEYRDDGIKVKLSSGDELEAEKLLVSIGRKLNSGGLGLDQVGVKMDERGRIDVNKKMETSVPNIYAIGDVVGGVLLAHVASFEGICAAENAMGKESTMDYTVVPACIFTHPEIGSVGLTPDKASEAGHEIETSRFSFGGLGKALAMGEDRGFVQLVAAAKTEKLLGAQIMGPHASDLIHEVALAISLGATAEQVSSTIHAHPTLSEAIMEAAEGIHGQAIHAMPRKK